jgi:hypothetical protein
MKPWLFRIELAVDRLLPYLIIVMLFVVIGDIFYADQVERYATAVNAFDMFTVLVFIVDLAFKYSRVSSTKEFFRLYWLDIIAILPLFLFIRVIEESFLLSEAAIARTQRALHAGVELEKESVLIALETERAARLSRLEFVTKLIRPISRAPRLAKAFTFYEKPTHTKHKA